MSKQKHLFWESINTFFRVTGNYLKAQLIFFVINFTLFTIFLWIFGVPVPALIAFFIAVLDFLPVVGSGLVFVPWSAINFITGNATLGWQLALLYIGMVVLRLVLEPIIVGKKIGLHPLITFAVALGGMLLFGLPGLILGPIIAAALASIYRVRLRRAEQKKKEAEVPAEPVEVVAEAETEVETEVEAKVEAEIKATAPTKTPPQLEEQNK